MRTFQKLYLPIKRLIGLLGSINGILFCAALLWWWIFLINLFVTRGHPIFCQKRLGKNERVFNLLKFRSMIAINGSEKETKFGSFLRKTSLDETLQLFNILIGNMAFIGPRPGNAFNEEELVTYRKEYVPNAFDVKPGITGYAQIMLNKGRDPKEKAYWDYMYVLNFGFALDVKIFFITIFKLFSGFKGNSD